MAVRLRLTRVGKKKQPTYRIVAADARSPRDGKYLEIVGTYDPRREPSAITVDNEKAIEWLKKGAPAVRARREAAQGLRRLGRVPGIEGLEVSDDAAEPTPAHASAVLEHIAKSLVESPEGVRVEVVDGSPRQQLNLYVADGDMGRIIGKRGRMASAIRTVTRAAAARDGVEIDVEFVD